MFKTGFFYNLEYTSAMSSSERGITVNIGEATKQFGNLVVEVRPIVDSDNILTTDTQEHEALHVLAAQPDGGIKSATCIADGNSLGKTVPVVMTARAAAAPAAMGYAGTSWDEAIVQHGLGVDLPTAKASARALVEGQEMEIREIAIELGKKGTIVQSDVDTALERASNKRAGIRPVEVKLENTQTGHKDSYNTTSQLGGVVLIENQWVDVDYGNDNLAKAA